MLNGEIRRAPAGSRKTLTQFQLPLGPGTGKDVQERLFDLPSPLSPESVKGARIPAAPPDAGTPLGCSCQCDESMTIGWGREEGIAEGSDGVKARRRPQDTGIVCDCVR